MPEQEPEPKYSLGEYVNDSVCDSFCVGRDPARALAQGEEDGVQDPEHMHARTLLFCILVSALSTLQGRMRDGGYWQMQDFLQ